jgi:hypothetical protein
MCTDRENLAARIESELRLHDLIATVIVSCDRIGAGRGPAHRTPAAARRPQHQRIFRIRIGLDPKTAADIGRNYPKPVLGEREYVSCNLGAHGVGRLRTGIKGKAVFGRVVIPDHGARLHGVGGKAIVLQSQ